MGCPEGSASGVLWPHGHHLALSPESAGRMFPHHIRWLWSFGQSRLFLHIEGLKPDLWLFYHSVLEAPPLAVSRDETEWRVTNITIVL